jgi:hypothetical protein
MFRLRQLGQFLFFTAIAILMTACATAQAADKLPLWPIPPTLPGALSELDLQALIVTDDQNVTDMAEETPLPETESAEVSQAAQKLYLPTVANQKPLAWRLGYASTSSTVYPELETIKAGWYLNWGTNINPMRPNGMEFAQMVRVHQAITCELRSPTAHDRTLCPYVVPHTYTYRPSQSRIQQIANANPGSLWLLGNEIDRRDWPGDAQDEILPEVYAVAYHDLYTLIKAADPQARVAIGGVVQTTPLRLEYLSKVWTAYQTKYGTPMPVDVWNMHVFVLPEKRNSWGADIPVGSDALTGAYIFRPDHTGQATTPMPEHMDLKYVDEQVRAMRAWMKERGQQQKPLIITEYGILLPNIFIDNTLLPGDAQPSINFMLGSFNYFLNTKDCSLGYAADECRLVQRWVWWSLDYNGPSFNHNTSLFNKQTKALNPVGAAFRDWLNANMAELSKRPLQ